MSQGYLADGNTKEVTIQGQKVVIQKVSYDTQKSIADMTKDGTTASSIDTFLIKSIKSWDLVDESSVPLPVTIENFNRLTAEFANDVIKACTEFNNLGVDEAKN